MWSKKPFCICYGDLGVAYALYRANKFLKNSEIDKICAIIFTESSERKQGYFPPDASITYGASGLSIFFEKLFNLTNDTRFYKAKCYWNNQILNYATNENQFAGFYSMTSKEIDLWNYSFSWGIIGIGIVMMKSINPDLPDISSLTMLG